MAKLCSEFAAMENQKMLHAFEYCESFSYPFNGSVLTFTPTVEVKFGYFTEVCWVFKKKVHS